MKIRFKKAPWALVAAVALLGTAACDTDSLLEVIDPDLVTPDAVQGEKGADLYWAGALGQFAQAYSSGTSTQVLYSGMLTDEFILSGTFPTRNEVDRREMDNRNGTLDGVYRTLHQARVGLKNAAERLEEFVPGDSRIAEMWNLNGYTYVFFAENYCSGVPFGETPNEGDVIQGTQTSTADMLTTAISRFNAGASAAAGSSDQARLAAVGLGRAYLNQGNYSQAASAVASVPTDWTYLIRSKAGATGGQRNTVYEMNFSQRRWSLPDGEGGNGIMWQSDADNRVPWEDSGTFGFDEETPLIHQLKYISWEDDTPVASGVEARLIEAEAQYQSGDVAGMMATLNALRATEGLDPLTDPGSADARVDMLFEERARWLFATSHRLGDLRRLIRQYGRSQADVFPSGDFHKGGAYGQDVNFPVPFIESENPNVEPSSLCFDRSA